jgi:hypothetical protein
MSTPFLLLLAAGVGFRLTLSWILRKRFNLDLAIPQALAGALLVLACLPSLFHTSWCDPWCGAPGPSLHAEVAMTNWHLKEDDVVVLRTLDDIPEHLFQVLDVYEDCITGYAITGPLKGVYGEPELELILRVHSRST